MISMKNNEEVIVDKHIGTRTIKKDKEFLFFQVIQREIRRKEEIKTEFLFRVIAYDEVVQTEKILFLVKSVRPGMIFKVISKIYDDYGTVDAKI